MTEDTSTRLLTALTTEHFVLQTAISASVNEQQARASMYLYALSGALVAMGFLAESPRFLWFVAAILPAVFLMGALTVLRIIDISMESMQASIGIAVVRSHYRDIDARAPLIFSADGGRWPEASTVPALAAGPTIGMLTTAAAMIASVNAVVAAVGVALLASTLGRTGLPVAVAIGVLSGVLLMFLAYAYQARRIEQMDIWSEKMGVPSPHRRAHGAS